MTASSAALRFIQSLGRSGMRFDLDRMRKALEALGNPQDKFPSVHIAGTNGKGSVAAMIATTLKSVPRLNVGLYTSPHLTHLEERFQINGRSVSPRRLAGLTNLIRKKTRGIFLTQFEFLTALVFLYFAEEKIDVAVVEVGLGGRLDATNLLKNVFVSVITTIDLDHTDWLGNTILKIAGEKAGIIKEGVPVVTGTDGAALRVIRAVAKKKGSPIYTPPSLPIERRWGGMQLQGPHQQKNARIAYMALRLLGRHFPLTNKAIIRGIQKTRWPGRFEIFFIGSGRRRKKIILDGAHNPAAMKALIQTLKQKKIKKVNLLFGALRDKDFKSMINIIAPFVNQCITVPVSSNRTASAVSLAKDPLWRNRARSKSSIKEGWKELSRLTDKNPLLVTGSLYLIGDIRKKVARP